MNVKMDTTARSETTRVAYGDKSSKGINMMKKSTIEGDI